VVHDWLIAPKEYARHEARRGRRYAYEAVDVRRTALVVVDVVPFFAEESDYVRGIVPNINALATAVRGGGGTVAWVLPAAGPATPAAPTTCSSRSRRRARLFPGRCDLDERLRARGIDMVVITGTVTSVCCESTARDASTLGYRVVLVADATADVNDAVHNAALRTTYRTFGDVRPTAGVLALIEGRGPASSS
jgi:nicotinamidase-related amidase